MHLAQQRLDLLAEEIALMLRTHAELDPEVMRGLLQHVWDMSRRETKKGRLWGVRIANPRRAVHPTTEEWETFSPEERALILASYRAMARFSGGEHPQTWLPTEGCSDRIADDGGHLSP